MFKRLPIERLLNAEFLEYFSILQKIVRQDAPHNEFLNDIAGKINEKNLFLFSLFERNRSSTHTKIMKQADERRDKAITGITYFLISQSKHFSKTRSEPALLLLREIKRHGPSITRMNYQAETATINNILTQMRGSAKLMEAVSALDLEEWLDELDAANELFTDNFLKRIFERAKKSPVKPKDLRKELIQLYRHLLKHIEISAKLGEEGEYNKLIRTINALNKKYNTLLQVRWAGDNANEDKHPEAVSEKSN